MIKETIDKAISTAGELVENDKTLIIFTLLVYGVVVMLLRLPGSVELIEKLSAGMLGMAIGRGMNGKGNKEEKSRR